MSDKIQRINFDDYADSYEDATKAVGFFLAKTVATFLRIKLIW